MSSKFAVADLELEADELDPAQIVAGTPEVSSAQLWQAPDGGTAVGVWEITPGTVTDTEADETFVVTAGSATIHFESGQVLDVRAGDFVVLHAGERTRWVIHETLRKVYTVAL